VRVADALDMEQVARAFRSRGRPNIHSLSAAAIDDVTIGGRRERAVRIEIAMEQLAGLFQVDELLATKLRGSGLEEHVEVVARIDAEHEKRLLQSSGSEHRSPVSWRPCSASCPACGPSAWGRRASCTPAWQLAVDGACTRRVEAHATGNRTATIAISVLVLLADPAAGSARPRTLLNAILIGVAIDVMLPLLPGPGGNRLALAFVAGIALVAVAAAST